jgi:UDP-3-O-[3-hydroxymyristoyl] glucosamine N-acyltransferase
VALSGQVGVLGHLELGDGVQVGAQSGVHHSIPAGQAVTGSPARPHREFIRIMGGFLPRLPDMYQRLKKLEEKLTELSARLEEESKS